MTNTTPLSQPESVDMVEANDSTVKTDNSTVTIPMYSSSLNADIDNAMNIQEIPLDTPLSTDTPEAVTPTDSVVTTSTAPATTTDAEAPYSYSDSPTGTAAYPPVSESVYTSLYSTSEVVTETTTEPAIDDAITRFKPSEPVSTWDSPPTRVLETRYSLVTEVEAPTPAAPESLPALSPEDVHLLTTGQRLRQLREQKHLTIQNVADKLYLDHSVIQALENDSYMALPPPIFVRGYLRGYAKILEVPATALIEKYDNFVGHKSPPPITPQAKPKKQATTDDLWVKLLTYSIFVTLMILMVLWGINHYGLLTPTPEANNAIPTGENLDLHPNVGEGDYVPPPEGDDDKPVAGQPVVAPPPPPPVTPPPPPVDLRALTIHYQKTGSWTRVIDTKGTKVYEGTPKSGDIINIKGEPPFKVRFGAGNSGIEIEYKGQKAAAETYPKSGKTLTVGEAIPATPTSPSSPTPAPR
jgi:cytoskeleton protein RodZ